MASDFAQVMASFGHDQFYILAHDRGARVAHRLALDYPDKVKGMVLLDIAPTLWMYEHTDMAFVSGIVVLGEIAPDDSCSILLLR
jgi:haloacetate dehalogenase